MTITATTSKATFNGNDSATSFPFTFKILDQSHLVVVHVSSSDVETVKTITTDYTVSLNADQETNPGGTITYPVSGGPLATGDDLIVYRNISAVQTTDMDQQGQPFLQVESALDWLTMITQQQQNELSRSIKSALSDDAGINLTLPAASSRAGKYLAFNAGGAVTASSGTGADSALRSDLADNSSGNGSELVAYNPSGVGAVATTVQSKLRRQISVWDFGPTGDGATNDLDAFNAAIAYLNTITTPVVLVLTGSFSITGSLNPITTNHKYIDGRGAKITHDAGTLFTWGSGVAGSCSYGGIYGLEYLVPTTPTSGTCFIEQSGMVGLLIQGIRSFRTNIFLKAGTTAYAGGYYIRDCRLTTYNGTQTVIEHGEGANSNIQGLDMTASGVSRVIDEETSGGATPSGATATAIKFGSNTWDTAVWDGLLINGYLFGVDINRSVTGKNVTNFRVTNFFFDFCANGMRMWNQASGGGINNMYFANGWFVGMDGYGVHLQGSVGSHRGIKFTNVISFLSGKNNWRLASTTMTGVVIDNCVGAFANRLNATNTGVDQDDFYALSGGFKCINSEFGDSAEGLVTPFGTSATWQGRYGFTPPVTGKDWVFENNRLEGATGAYNGSIASNTITAGGLFSSSVKNNHLVGGATAISYATSGPLTAPTSAAVQTNNTPYTFDLYIYGGTVSQVTLNSTEVSTSTGCRITVTPGATWTVTYSSAPTIKRIIYA